MEPSGPDASGPDASGTRASAGVLAWVSRWRWWVAAAAAVVVAAAIVAVVIGTRGPSSDVQPLRRIMTGRYTGPAPTLDRVVSTAVDDPDSGDGTGFFAYVTSGTLHVHAFRPGSSAPVWSVRGDRPVTEIQRVELVDGVLIVMVRCAGVCDRMIGIEARTGARLWTQRLPGGGVVGTAGGVAAINLIGGDAGTVDGTVGVEVRTGRAVWELPLTGNYDRTDMAEGSDRLVRFTQRGALELVDVRTGQVRATADVSALVPAAPTDVSLSTSGDVVALSVAGGGSPSSAVYSATDLAKRWERPGRVTAIASGVLDANDGRTRQVLDTTGRQLWRPKEAVGYLVVTASWGIERFDEGTAVTAERYRYVDVRTGRRLAEDRRYPAWGEREGVIQVENRTDTAAARLYYLHLPSGDTTDLGRHVLNWVTCTYGHTLLACVDATGQPGLWRYRDR